MAINLYINRTADNKLTATVKTTKGDLTGKACGSEGRAIQSLNTLIKNAGKAVPEWNIIRPESPTTIAFLEETTPAIESEEAEPATIHMAPVSEPEPELHRLLKPVEGRISPLSDPERWVAIYRGVVARYGNDAEMVLAAMKGMNAASPYERDADGRPFHMYSDNNLVRAPRPGEGERRQTRGLNGYNRDYKGRTPVEPGSLARDTDPHHPANRPERGKRMTKADRMAAGRAENAMLRANDPAGFEAKTIASKLASAASKAANGNTAAYKTAFVAVCTVLGAGHLEKCAKFSADLGMTEVPAAWLDWAKASIAASKAA